MTPVRGPRLARGLVVQVLGIILIAGTVTGWEWEQDAALDPPSEPEAARPPEPIRTLPTERVLAVPLPTPAAPVAAALAPAQPPAPAVPLPTETPLTANTPPPAQGSPASGADPEPAPPPIQPTPAPSPDRPRPVTAASQSRPPSAPTPKPSPSTTVVEQKDVTGVPLRVFVPDSASGLEAHLRATGACIAVARALPGSSKAEVLAAFDLLGGRLVERQVETCRGVPRLLRQPANSRLGDPLGLVRAALGADVGGELMLQVVLSGALEGAAEKALQVRFGGLSAEERASQAASLGYVLQCFALERGGFSCR